MNNRLESLALLYVCTLGLLASLFIGAPSTGLAATKSFNVPDDVVLRIRLDDMLTSVRGFRFPF